MAQSLKEKYETVIGLEVHAQLKTKTKIFCNCSTEFGCPPNENVCPVCMGLPGVLPVLNKQVVDYAILTGLALNCKISEYNKFDRKQYFYPDLPKNYQISQYDMPICKDGYIHINGRDIKVNRIHMEEDAGKLVHAGSAGLAGSTYSLVDYNRTGVPLMEIVSEPDIFSTEEARDYMAELRNILRYLDVCDGNLEEGSLRCDGNISLRLHGEKELGTKVEIKNINSFRALQKALEYEEIRIAEILEEGGTVIQETRLWNDETQSTSSMRTKEFAHDYRYFPDPDLMPLKINAEWINEIKATMPELPEQKRTRYQEELGLSAYDAGVLVESKEFALFLDETVKLGANPKASVNWLMGDITFYIKENKTSLDQTKLTPESLTEMLQLIESNVISNSIGKQVIVKLIEEGGSAKSIVDKMGLSMISDEDELVSVIDKIIAESPKQVEQYKSGKATMMGFFVGQVMKMTKGRANPQTVNKLVKDKLDG